MPRMSSEARSASLYRAGTSPLRVPSSLKPAAARAIWRATVQGKPSDYFRPSDSELLTRYCTLNARAAELERLLAATPADDPDGAGIERRLVAIAGAVGGLAQRLRLNPAARIERHSGQRAETANNGSNATIVDLGGYAVHGRPQ